MTREEKLDEALKNMDFYELAKLTMGDKQMKVEVKYIESEEQLTRCGNKFFTKEQLEQIRKA